MPHTADLGPFNTTDIFGLERELEYVESDEEVDRVEEELEYKRAQQEAIKRITSEFESTRFTAAAWAYQMLTQGELAEDTFREIFSESIKNRYSSFEALNEAYFRFFGQMRLDFMKWESDDADIFKGVQTSRPAVHGWLKEFYCAMGLILLNPDDFDDDIDESENPLEDLDIDRTSYPDLEESIKQISEEDLEKVGLDDRILDELDERKELFLKLDQQMEEILERREEDFIIESDLDPEKIENFQSNYVEKFKKQFVLRQILEELSWLDIDEHDEDRDPAQLVLNLPIPRGSFIEEPPTEYVHHIDRQVTEHINGIMEQWLDEEVSQVEVEGHEELLDTVEEVCTEEGEVEAIVISSFRARQSFARSDKFDVESGESGNVLGRYQIGSDTVPVYMDSSRDFSVLVLSGSGEVPEVTELRKDRDIVEVRLQEITREYLKEEEGEDFEEMDEEEIRERLQGVWIHAYYYWEMESRDGFGTKITVKEP